MLRRAVRAETVPTKLAREIMAQQRQADEQAQQGDQQWPDEAINHGSPRNVLHAFLDRAHARYLAQFPPGHEPLALALAAWGSDDFHGRDDAIAEAEQRARERLADALAAVAADQAEDDNTQRPAPQETRRHH